ncbi:probable DNA replication complex GINS protein PSF2 [Cephalotrichum gorgonifer]|uniref:DNA replication complex GINS protein PSF2 n=1 Tax=Cephalotrichum gorgonifer TaxID=2041049 RepID=A0AAE8ST40_9PEZI|nr:probable DNA replication complex GINS protein PSF2 [Cephalotrichum gorgonifer]
MALPLHVGLIPSEVAFLCEMELVTVIPRQRLDSINLLGGPTPDLRPPRRSDIPLWLALLLKKQRRANIVPPPWLHPTSLAEIVHHETNVDPDAFSPPPPPPVRPDGYGSVRRVDGSDVDPSREPALSPPFLPSCTADAPTSALPYHWLEVSEMILAHASDDVPSPEEARTLLRDLREVRAAKMRASTAQFEGGVAGVMSLTGVGAMELAESRGFVLGVVEGVRKLGASAEAARREEEEEEGREGEESDGEMEL